MTSKPRLIIHAGKSLSTAILITHLGVLPVKVMAHVGHGNEFQGVEQTPVSGAVQVDSETAKRLELKVEPVVWKRLTFGVKTTGEIEPLPNQQVEITTPVSGTITRLLVQPGDIVQVGQPVAMMTSPELAELRTIAFDRKAEAMASVQQAQAELRLAQENYRQQVIIATAEINQARTRLRFAQERYDKDQELLENGAISRRTFLESEAALADAKANLAKSESRLQVSEAFAQLQRSQSELEVAQSRINLSDQTYQTRLRQLGARPNADGTLTLVTPIAGVVADRETTVGESGQDAGKKVMTIVNSSTVQVSGNIFEKDLGRVQVGQPVRVTVNGFPNRAFNGEINVVGAMVNGESRVIPVKAALNNAAGLLKPGMFVELEVLTDNTPEAVLTIPKSALVENNDKRPVVYVQNGSAYAATEVTLGRESGNLVEVTSGLFDGDQVVTQRANQLYAQSLRGGTTVGDPNEASAASVSSPQSSAFPWWIMVPAGGAVAAGTFWAGILWANRRAQLSAMNPELHGHGQDEYGQEVYLNLTRQSEQTHSTKYPRE